MRFGRIAADGEDVHDRDYARWVEIILLDLTHIREQADNMWIAPIVGSRRGGMDQSINLAFEQQLALVEARSPAFYRHAFLAPDIVQAIVDGRQAPTLTADASSSRGIGCSGVTSAPGSRRSETVLLPAENSPVIGGKIPVSSKKFPVNWLREIASKSLILGAKPRRIWPDTQQKAEIPGIM